MTAARPPIRLCALDDIPDGGACALIAPVIKNSPTDTHKAMRQSLIAVRRKNSVWLYVNACPHVGAPLNMEPGQFLNYDKTLILCANHGALFTIDGGLCIHGPCIGKTLDNIPCRIEKGAVYLGSGPN
ncbi:Rieske (2Fe-2S) protein [Varunaivibrio sulfuroxidans]|uniref:Nitrite reductase/ring-hydroxylating ferredoxin subunit n=1 Tax=Varunaivibrio sulfuroxidans TaxID=1773489 RepID=A0A4R3JFD4_9PROT|nr:Rieske 2Fe-2S domain-containing protein [Varunaivibrio sulfuroxidans]TCS64818.1 nitrite reductase/ring-hydroxylating ferredoxin subunit [Varunaivibrio sulfuroxidans]WES29881.1 Rieske 2Fe-2S domain-containing protein [Varunaivibrio sulfuroxidans]